MSVYGYIIIRKSVGLFRKKEERIYVIATEYIADMVQVEEVADFTKKLTVPAASFHPITAIGGRA